MFGKTGGIFVKIFLDVSLDKKVALMFGGRPDPDLGGGLCSSNAFVNIIIDG